MLHLGYFVWQIKIMNDMCVVCSVFHFGCMGGIFGYVFIPLEIEENMETTSWFTILCSVIVYEV